MTPDERQGLRRLIDQTVRVRASIPDAAVHVRRTAPGDPTARFSDEEMRQAVRIVARRARELDELAYQRRVEAFHANLDDFMLGHSRRCPDFPTREPVVLGMRRYETLRDRSSTPSCNTIRRRHGSFHEFVASALEKE